jgi:ATP-dependent DNA helicase RecG
MSIFCAPSTPFFLDLLLPSLGTRYRLASDVIVRIFSDRIEVESPGLLVGPVTPANIHRVGPHSRNPLIIQHLRESPNPPNLDAGEGVRMMFGTMPEASLYPPQYLTRPRIDREAVVVYLLNIRRPSVWEQVSDCIDKNGVIGNAEAPMLMGTDNALGVSKQLKHWVEQGLLVVANPKAGRIVRRASKPDTELDGEFFSILMGKEPGGKRGAPSGAARIRAGGQGRAGTRQKHEKSPENPGFGARW